MNTPSDANSGSLEYPWLTEKHTKEAMARVAQEYCIQRDFFFRRLSVVGLTRKYGKRVAEIEEVLRWRKR